MRRPSPYAPLSVTFSSGRTGTALQKKYKAEGLGVWAAMIAAGKRGRGQIVFAHDSDWQAIGVFEPPSFSLGEFLKTTGHLKQTRTTRHGHVMYVQLTRYQDWNDDMSKGLERERKSRSDDESQRKNPGNEEELARTAIALELERELELEEDLEPRAVSETSNRSGFAMNSPRISHEQITPELRSIA